MKYKVVYDKELYHFGVKGMKWGEWNEETRARYLGNRKARRNNSSKTSNQSGKRRKFAKTVLAAGGATLAVAATAYAVKNPAVRKVASKCLSKVGNVSVKVAKSTADGFKQGIKEGISEGPKKLGKAVAIGGYMVAGKLALDQILGKDVSNAIFKANDKKSIGKFWNGLPTTSEDDSDD